MATLIDWKRFAEVYNDLLKYPTCVAVGIELGISYQTVRNRASIGRAKHAAGEDVPAILNRQFTGVTARTVDQVSPEDHAKARAEDLAEEIYSLVTNTRYPLINAEAIVVESHMSRGYNRESGIYESRESTPRTWLSDTLKVAPVERGKSRRYIFTGAQNDTPIHEGFWENLQAYAKDIKAEIVVGPWTYETQWWSENNPTARSYDERITEYLCFGQMKIGEKFMFAGEMNTLPTASQPISDLVTYSRGRWAVFPHAKRQLKSVPSTDPNIQAHQVMTTGSVTRPKVIPRKAGVKSIFHHVVGAVVVEFDKDGDLFCRHVSASNDGAFYDLDAFVKNGKVTRGHRLKAIVGADIHRRKLGPVNAKAVFGLDIKTGKIVNKTNILDTMRPEHFFAHDLFDNETRNHHNVHDNAMNYELAFRGHDLVMDELKEAADFIQQIERPWLNVNVVDSNHDLALERYVRDGRYRMDGKNIRLGLQLEDAYLEYRERVGTALDEHKPVPKFSLLEYALRKLCKFSRVRWLYDGTSFVLDGVECAHHGFRGANGARGTVTGFAKLGRKISIGDKHSPEIMDGVYVAGVMQLQQGYNKGPSGWAVTLIFQYPDGKRALITLQNGKWRG